MVRLLAVVSDTGGPVRVRHYEGVPPEVSGDSTDNRTLLPSAAALIVDETPEGTYIYRFDRDGNELADTWHHTIDDALHQVEFEYPGLTINWEQVSPTIQDLEGLAKAKLQRPEAPRS
jgi:hypothetical protein